MKKILFLFGFAAFLAIYFAKKPEAPPAPSVANTAALTRKKSEELARKLTPAAFLLETPLSNPLPEPERLRSPYLNAEAFPSAEETLRDRRGQMLKVGKAQALQECEKRGMRLATIKELVLWGGRFHPARPDPVPAGFADQSIDAKNPDGTEDHFFSVYGNNPRDARLPEELAQHWYWSASVRIDQPGEPYALDGGGYVSAGESDNPEPRYHLGALHCMKKEQNNLAHP
jgi:hypothetical protein